MDWVFYISATVAIVATLLVITEVHAVHALLYLIVSLLAVALVFFVLGAPFIAALEVIVYAGAILVLFLFIIMMISLGPGAVEQENRWLSVRSWVGPSLLSLVLLVELFYVLAASNMAPTTGATVGSPKDVGVALFGPYALGVELGSMLLLAGLVGAYHLGKRERATVPEGEGGE